LLLTKFLYPCPPSYYAGQPHWAQALGEAPETAMQRLQSEGLLAEPTLPVKMSATLLVPDLKAQLKARNLKVSGRKDELIQRLIEADSVGMENLVAGKQLLVCTQDGKEIAEQTNAEMAAEKGLAEQEVLTHLQNERLEAACRAVASYEARQVFPRGLGIEWSKYDPAQDVAKLREILHGRPKFLSRLPKLQMDALRVPAAMMELWGASDCGKWLPSDLHTPLRVDNDTAARMLVFFAHHRADMAEYRALAKDGFVKCVEILSTEDSCEACKKLSKKRYGLNEVPELPYEHCTNEMGCRCLAQPVFSGE
jgi:hypothetical protein